MILVADIGNTHVVFGVYSGEELLCSMRLQSDRGRTVDEFALEIFSLLQLNDIARDNIRHMVLGSVVPPLTRVFVKLAQKYLHLDPLVVDHRTNTGIDIAVDEPRALGADRLVNAVAARALYGAPVVVVDFGTATTFDVVGREGAYQGGLICPGLMISANALFERAAMLTKIELKAPTKLVGKNTHDAMVGGIVYGYAGLVDGIITRLIAEIGEDLRVVATGGLAALVSAETKYVKTIAPELTLQGLVMIGRRNLAPEN